MSRRRALVAATALASALILSACGTAADSGSTASAETQTLTVYSGRSEELVKPLFEGFTKDTGIEVDVRYAGTAELAAQLLEEGDRSPADVFFSQDAGALGALDQAGLLAPLPATTLDKVPATYRSESGTWVGTSARARVLLYNDELVPQADLPSSVLELAEPEWKGKVGIAPTNASFQSFVTGMRLSVGEEQTAAWLEALTANDVKIFEGNGAIRDAVDAGQIAVGLANHYYWYERAAEVGADTLKVQNHFLASGDAGSLVNVAGAAVLKTGADNPSAQAFVDYLLSSTGQEFFSTTTFEYPVVAGIAVAEGLPALETLRGPDVALGNLADLAGTQAMLEQVGLL
jgi:iron(III) transport system substrate-binding protein